MMCSAKVMIVAARTASALALAAALSLTGCFVSFQDYPLAGLGSGGGGGSGAGGASSGGSGTSDSGTGGSAAGDSAFGGAGAGGSGGASTPPPEPLLDDFEDGDSQVLLVAGRNGAWFAANDGTALQTPDPHVDTLPALLTPPNGASLRALHTSGAGFTVWGALVGANFVVSGTTAMPYSISAYQGLSFSAKVGKVGCVKQVRVSIRNYDTVYGCTGCGDHFGATATLGDTFQTIFVPFSSLKQQGWGRPLVASFDSERTYAVTFTWAAFQTFDVWIDNLSFY
jgi:hypothetical protein